MRVTLIGLRRRQMLRLLRGPKQDGATSLVSKRRGKPSNHRLPAEARNLAVAIVRERDADFGPTLAAEKLAAHHGYTVSRETLRGWMLEHGFRRFPGKGDQPSFVLSQPMGDGKTHVMIALGMLAQLPTLRRRILADAALPDEFDGAARVVAITDRRNPAHYRLGEIAAQLTKPEA